MIFEKLKHVDFPELQQAIITRLYVDDWYRVIFVVLVQAAVHAREVGLCVAAAPWNITRQIKLSVFSVSEITFV